MKQIPAYSQRNVSETITEYLNKHAKEWAPPTGKVHLHLIYARTVHWRVVTRASSVCKVPGRCQIVFIVFMPPKEIEI